MTSPWPQHPIIYQINTLVWLNTLSARHQQRITLANIPQSEIDALAQTHADAVWLMGIWHRGEKCRASALNYIHEYRAVLPDVTPEDVVGSAYAIGAYTIDEAIGGRQGLAAFRQRIAAQGMRLVLDFVPNHVGLDHPWISEHPEYFMLGTEELLAKDSGNFFSATNAAGKPIVVAHGRDPHFPGWIDTAQLNAFHPGLRQAAIATLKDIASQCDAVRCDMAMLMTDSVFQRTWGWLGTTPMPQPYWPQVIGAVRQQFPHFLFIAEVYWNMEFQMLQEGFDYTYDKVFYDRVVERNAEGIFRHLEAEPAFLRRNIRFIENHDEKRAATTLGPDRSRAAATLIATLPGAVLLHDGQFEGRRAKLPVQITRQPDEEPHQALRQFYLALMSEASQTIYREGQWSLFRRSPAAGGSGHQNIIAYGWRHYDDLRLIVVNIGSAWSQAVLDVSPWADALRGFSVSTCDIFDNATSAYDGDSIAANGLPVALDAHHASILRLSVAKKPQKKPASVEL